jgi:hypothetical protein
MELLPNSGNATAWVSRAEIFFFLSKIREGAFETWSPAPAVAGGFFSREGTLRLPRRPPADTSVHGRDVAATAADAVDHQIFQLVVALC